MVRSMNGQGEIQAREKRGQNMLKFGIPFLDDITKGISAHDLVLVGARSGAGKTQLCCEVMDANILDGKKVLFVALEAEPYEIESRLKYKLFYRSFKQDSRSQDANLQFDLWMLGKYVNVYPEHEQIALEQFDAFYKDKGFIKYKTGKFDVIDLIETVVTARDLVDLIIIDHAHYFDFEDEENKALKTIASTCRTLTLEHGKPIILVAHMRKPDRHSRDLAPDMYEFHGSSDLFKIATKIITLAPGKGMTHLGFETFMRAPKARFNGGYQKMVARTYYSQRLGGYCDEYELGWADSEQFEDIGGDSYPAWARERNSMGSNGDHALARKPANVAKPRGQIPSFNSYKDD